MKQQQAERLQTLATFLRTEVPEDKFDMSTWGTTQNIRHANKIAPITDVCGTSACALGWATAIWPETFRLEFCSFDEGESDAEIVYRRNDEWVEVEAEGPEVLGWFGLTFEEANELFYSENMTRAEKADQIESLLENHGFGTTAEEQEETPVELSTVEELDETPAELCSALSE